LLPRRFASFRRSTKLNSTRLHAYRACSSRRGFRVSVVEDQAMFHTRRTYVPHVRNSLGKSRRMIETRRGCLNERSPQRCRADPNLS
jgi:hypothetical protein